LAVACDERFSLSSAAAPRGVDVAALVRAGLTAREKTLPCALLYDPEGARWFEEITELPEYYLCRAETEILARHAAELAKAVPVKSLLELGSGSARKTRLILSALLARVDALVYVPVDIAKDSLLASGRALTSAYPGLNVRALEGDYEDGVSQLAALAGPRLALWLGSNVGNLHRDQAAGFLGRVRAALGQDGAVLVGVDLRKAAPVLERAYDDAAGVTARFNRNLLARINRELGGEFAPETFVHRAIYNQDAGRIEMYLVSTRAQSIAIAGLGLTVEFAAGEAIHTENCYKYSRAEIDALAAGAGLAVRALWTDAEARFADVLLVPA
jgi:L-histidine N-alpha-methyltransferase